MKSPLWGPYSLTLSRRVCSERERILVSYKTNSHPREVSRAFFLSGNTGGTQFRHLQRWMNVMAMGAGVCCKVYWYWLLGDLLSLEGIFFFRGVFCCWGGSHVAGGSVFARRDLLLREGSIVAGWWRVCWCWLQWGLTLLPRVFCCWGGILLDAVHCCLGDLLLMGGGYCCWLQGNCFTAFLVINTNYLAPQVLLGSVFSKRDSTGRWVWVGTKGRCSKMGRGWRQEVSLKGGVPIFW